MSASVDRFEKIPNNVQLNEDRRLQRALETWQPDYLQWWMDMGPTDFQKDQIYLRTAISVEPSGWAHFDYVRMPEYRWGIFLAPSVHEGQIRFGDNMGKPVWNDVPGEFRNALRRIIVTQGDTEPASVEQQRKLGHTAPSLYDLRNLFQVNVEEGRHLWAMVYLLHKHFGRDGREEAEELLQRRSGNPDKPRILGAFNQPVENWLDFFMFTMFTDRDGKYQLLALSESGFDPLARTTKFMLTEEAHHMFVGETGIYRIVERTCELMKKDHGSEDVRKLGGIDLPTMQKYINLWYSLSADLFGGEISTNASNYFGASLKGRAQEDGYSEHQAKEGFYKMEVVENGKVIEQDVPLRNAMNEVLRDSYIQDCQRGCNRWNKIIEQSHFPFRLKIPSRRFNRHIGIYSGMHFTPEGDLISADQWERYKNEWLPSESDRAFIQSLMTPVYEIGKISNWIAPPQRGINQNPFEFEYVKFEHVRREV
jgi:benzoyl-CoA 2,3-dioxygenase component B